MEEHRIDDSGLSEESWVDGDEMSINWSILHTG